MAIATQRLLSEQEEAREILAVYGLDFEAIETKMGMVQDIEMLCAWCEPTLAPVSHGICEDHAALVKNSY